jgi:MFS family permease
MVRAHNVRMDTGSVGVPTGQQVIARLERLEVWSLSYLFIGIIGLGFLFTFYDIFDINVSFIQTCIQLNKGCTPESALEALPLPVLLNLVGYVVGTLVLSPIADRIGRRNMLMITMLITGLGSLYNAFVGDYLNFNIARTITGIGIGADLAIVNTYINEVAPRRARAKFTTIIFIMSALGAFVGIDAMAPRAALRGGGSVLRDRLAVDVRDRRDPCRDRDSVEVRAPRIAAVAHRAGPYR